MAHPSQNRVHVALSSFALFCLALVLSAYSSKNPGVARVGTVVATEVLAPFQILYGGLQHGVSGIWSDYINLVGVEQENLKLRERLAMLEAENSTLLEFRHENERLRALVGIGEAESLKGVIGSVIAYDPSNWERTAVVNRGTLSGVQTGMAVVHNNGVVGQIVAAGPTASRVLLLTDHASGIDAVVQGSRIRGVVEGSGERQCRLRFVLSEDEVKIGDRVISSGMDGVYPKGLLIGIVSDLRRSKSGLFQLIEVRPSVDLSRLENVMIITAQNKIDPVIKERGEE